MADQYTADHDILIELRTEFRGFREEVRGVLVNYSALNAKVEKLERLNLPEKMKEHDQVYDWSKSIKANWKLILGMIGVISGIVGGVSALVEILYYGSHIK